MFDIFNQHLAVVATVISLAILVMLYFALKPKVDFWWLNFWYGLPFIGKSARLSKDTTRNARNKEWTNAERTLCEDYKRHIHFITEAELDNRIVYLAKANDLGRTPTPLWLVIVLALLVIAEGLGFSYLLGSWMAMEGSEDTRNLLMVAIVLVLCVILIFVTHSAGHQLYRTNLIRASEKEWRDAGQPAPFKSRTVMLKDDQLIDDAQPEYTQLVNRVGTSGSYFMVVVAVAIIVVIAVTSTWMRVKHLENEQTQETLQSGVSSATGNPFSGGALALPREVTAPQAEADSKGVADRNEAHATEGLAAFIMLGFIFVVTQVVGIAAGFKWGFAGKESRAAYTSTRGFSTYDDYQAKYAPVIQVAQSRLQTLQQQLARQNGNQSLDLRKGFDDYLGETRVSHPGPAGAGAHAATQDTAVSAAAAPVAAAYVAPAQATPTVPAAAPVAALATVSVTVEQAFARFAELKSDQAAAKAYVSSLPLEVREPLIVAIKEKKARDAAEEAQRERVRNEDQLNELF
jgi:hypothetical protein